MTRIQLVTQYTHSYPYYTLTMLTQTATFTNEYTVNNVVTTMIQILDTSKMTAAEFAEKFMGIISPEDRAVAKKFYVVSLATYFRASNRSAPAIAPTFDAYFGSYDTRDEATDAVHAIVASLAPDFGVATRNLARHKAEERRQARTFDLMRYNSKCLKDLRDKNATAEPRAECQGSAKKKPRTAE